MADWMLPHITDYWDQRVEAIERLSRVLAETPEAGQYMAQLELIVGAVTRHAQALDDDLLTQYAVAVADDLYKAFWARSYFDGPLFQYLTATTRPFFRELSERGYTVQYFIDNTVSQLDGPVVYMPLWFRAASLGYVCPQHIAATSFEEDRPSAEWPSLINKNIVQARSVAEKVVEQAHREGRHFVYLDTDTTEDFLQLAFKTTNQPGVIHIFRNDAYVPGGASGKVAIDMPPGPRVPKAQPAGAMGASPAQPTSPMPAPATPAARAEPVPESKSDRPKGLRSLFSRKGDT